ncbi:MAG: hypothetical protein Q4F23_02755 [Coriobacteriia bacterium]|nr:hypothetical protein [Coriobacteriia bacterium]
MANKECVLRGAERWALARRWSGLASRIQGITLTFLLALFAYSFCAVPASFAQGATLESGATYSIGVDLSCPVKSGPVNTDFGKGLVKSAKIVVGSSGEAVLQIKTGSFEGTLFNVSYTAFISNGKGQYLGYQDSDGAWHTDLTCTKGDSMSGTEGKVPMVTSFALPVDENRKTYSLGVYVNNAMKPTQFGYDGTNVAKYSATLVLDWSTLKKESSADTATGGGGGKQDGGSGSGANSGSGTNPGSGSSSAGSDSGNAGSSAGGSTSGGSVTGSGSASGSAGSGGSDASSSSSPSKDSAVKGSFVKGSATYSYELSLRKLSSFSTSSVCNGLFARQAKVVVSGDLAQITLYVIDPIPNYKQEGTPLSNVRFVYGGKAYKAKYGNSHKVKKSFAADALFISKAGTYSATPISVTLPADAVKASAKGGLQCQAYVRAVIKSTQGFYVALSGGKLVSRSSHSGGLKASASTRAGKVASQAVSADVLGGGSDDESGVALDSSDYSSAGTNGLGGISSNSSDREGLSSGDSVPLATASGLTSDVPVVLWVLTGLVVLVIAGCVIRRFVRKDI